MFSVVALLGAFGGLVCFLDILYKMEKDKLICLFSGTGRSPVNTQSCLMHALTIDPRAVRGQDPLLAFASRHQQVGQSVEPLSTDFP